MPPTEPREECVDGADPDALAATTDSQLGRLDMVGAVGKGDLHVADSGGGAIRLVRG